MGDQRVTVHRVRYWDGAKDAYAYPKKMRQLDFIEKTGGMSVIEGTALQVKVSDLDDDGAYLPRSEQAKD